MGRRRLLALVGRLLGLCRGHALGLPRLLLWLWPLSLSDGAVRSLLLGADRLFEARLGLPQRDFVAVMQVPLALNTVSVDEGAVEATQVAKDKALGPLLDDAVLLRDDFVQQLDRVAGMPAKRVGLTQLDDLLSFRCRENKTSHGQGELSCESGMSQSGLSPFC
jgi:hypothetical protein